MISKTFPSRPTRSATPFPTPAVLASYDDAIDTARALKPRLRERVAEAEKLRRLPAENVGDIPADLAQRRGRPSGQDMLPGGMTVIKAQAPLSKLSDYHSRLSSITGGKGSYSMELSHYAEVPGNLAQELVAKSKVS